MEGDIFMIATEAAAAAATGTGWQVKARNRDIILSRLVDMSRK